MAVEIKFTGAGESITEATVLKWLKPDGSAVKAGDAVVELETDKASKEEYATSAGVLSIKVQAGTRVDTGAVLGLIDPNGKATVSEAKPAAPSAAVPAADVRLSPAARVMAETQGVDASKITPSAKGVVTKGDLLAQAQTPAAPAVPLAKPVGKPGERETRVRMTPLRARIAERLLSAQQNAAILTTFNEADMTRVMEARAKYKEAFQKKHGVGLGFMSFFVKACIEGLKVFPSVNARIDGDEVVYHNYYHFGLAVSTERGLMVPVLRECDQLTFADIEKGIVGLAAKARDGKITVADLQGGTFTITNGGIFGSMMSTPILNPPQSAILGMHAIQKRAVVVEDQIVIRPMMYLALSYDHRLIDGREAVSFLVRVKECLENPERMLFEV
jgi:2-oxoglutarate dehydrogenase E2 component (dihydrolipoamide succinyltransferase)